jgi:hypothetical protein
MSNYPTFVVLVAAFAVVYIALVIRTANWVVDGSVRRVLLSVVGFIALAAAGVMSAALISGLGT